MNIKYLMVLVSGLALISGCATKSPIEKEKIRKTVSDLRLYQIYVNQYGNLLNPGTREKVSGDGEKRYVEEIIANFKRLKSKHPELTLTVFIHGGLNTYESATARVKDVKDEMLKEGKYPLFISWNSAPLSNYKDHLIYLRRGRLARVLGPLSTPFVFLEDALRSIARIPASTYEVVFGQNQAFNSILTKYNYEETQANSARGNLIGRPSIKIHDDQERAGLSRKDWLTVWNPVKLLTAPFVDGLGSGAWDSMLRRSDLVLRKDTSANGIESAYEPTAATKFFDRFSNEFKHLELDIIGHSMGAIVANNIISKYPELRFKNIVYMAAACKIKDIEYVVVPYLQGNSFATFYNLSLHPYRDISENVVYDFLPRGSLLMWIDQTFGEPNSFADRTAGYWFNIIRAADNIFSKLDSDKDDRVHLTKFGVEGGPQAHGDFNDAENKYWQKSFWRGEVPDKAGQK